MAVLRQVVGHALEKLDFPHQVLALRRPLAALRGFWRKEGEHLKMIEFKNAFPLSYQLNSASLEHCRGVAAQPFRPPQLLPLAVGSTAVQCAFGVPLRPRLAALPTAHPLACDVRALGGLFRHS